MSCDERLLLIGYCTEDGDHDQHRTWCGCRWHEGPGDRFFAPCVIHDSPLYTPVSLKRSDAPPPL